MNFNTKSIHVSDNLTEILRSLQKVKQTGNGKFIACCPVHSDRSPSLAITEKPDKMILLHCFGCGAGGVDICNALGIDPISLFPPNDNLRFEKKARSGFSAWQLFHVLHADLVRLTIIASDLRKIGELSSDDRQFISEVITRINDGLSYLEGIR